MKAKSKRWMGLLILGAMLVCLFSGLAHAQENWVYIYDNPTNPLPNDEQFNDIARNPVDGYIYCTGLAYRGYGVNHTVINVQKLNPVTGDTIWTYRYTPDPNPNNNIYGEGFEIAFDDAGCIYVAGTHYGGGYASKMFTVIKLDTSGTLLHDDMYYPIHNYRYRHKALSIYYGPDGYIYAAGYARTDNAADFVVRKYDTTLTPIHTYTFDEGSSDSASARSVVVDSDLNVWAAGYSYTSGGYAFCVVQLDTALNQTGIYEKNGYSTRTDEAFKVCLSWSGAGAYACGFLDNSGTAQDFFVVKLDAACGEAWSYSYPNSGEDKALALVSGPPSPGATYAVGFLQGDGKDYTVMCFSGSIPAWIYTANGTMDGSDDRALDIALDASGTFAYATGYLRDTGQDYDWYVTKHTAMDSLLVWTYLYNGSASEHDVAWSIDVVPDGNVYVAGGIEKDAGYYMAGAISLPQNMPPTIPELISPADGGFLNDTTVTFTWYASEAAEPGASVNGYYLRYSTDPTFTTANSVFCTDTFKTRTLNDTIYYWQVRARDTKNSWSKYSDALSFSFDLQSPDTPVLISPIDGVILLDTDVPFEWGVVTFMETPSPVTYVIQVDNDAGFPAPIIDTTDVDSITFELPGEDVYYWHVKAFDVAGNSGPYSGTESFTVDATPPLIDLTDQFDNTTSGGPFTINTQVTDVYGVDSVLLYYWRVMTEPTWYVVKMTAAADDWFQAVIPETIQDDDTTKYYIHAWDNASWDTFDPETAPTDYYWFIANHTGIEEFDTPAMFSFGLKSSPAKGKAMFNMSLPEDALITLRIYDVMGRLIDKPVSGTMTAGFYEIPWTPKAASGVYFYKFESPWKTENGKLVIVR